MVLILLVAAVIDAVIAIINGNEVADWAEVAVILAIVILNAVIGTAQEAKAAQSLEALKKMSSPSCTVRRDGKLKTVKATEVALGDVVILEEVYLRQLVCLRQQSIKWLRMTVMA